MSKNWWTEEDLAYLADTANEKLSKVASALGRTTNAVYKARRRLERGAFNTAFSWSADEDRVILDNPLWTAAQIAEKLPGRGRDAVAYRRAKLGIVGKQSHEVSPFHVSHRSLIAKTCSKCGLLLPSDWYRFDKPRNRWVSWCRKCMAEAVGVRMRGYRHPARAGRDYSKLANDLTRPYAENIGNPYTEADFKVLEDPKLTKIRKALILKRTYSGIDKAVRALGVKSTAGTLSMPESDQWIIDNPNAARIEEILASLQSESGNDKPSGPQWDWDDSDLVTS